MGYKKQSRRHQIKKGGEGIQWINSSYSDGTEYWYEKANPTNIVLENPWGKGVLSDGTEYWYETGNQSHIVFENPDINGFNPLVVLITGTTLINHVNVGGIYDRTNTIINKYPVYVNRNDDSLHIVYCRGAECKPHNAHESEFWQIRDVNEEMSSAPFAYIPGNYGGLGDCLYAGVVWKVKNGNTWIDKPGIKTLFGCTDKELDEPKCDFVKTKLNGGKRSRISRIRKRRLSRP